MKERKYSIKSNSEAVFNNKVDYCVGTGRMGLALQQAYQDQLKYVQNEIGFSYIRGHGLFSDDMAIYHEYKDENDNVQIEYNFTYLDMVMDYYLERNIRPFIELGFMPKDMASGDQTVFYWKGNVTPPADYEKWKNLIRATLNHLIERYGKEDVLTWPVEVWNEPNLPGFWKDADMEEYFRLFKESLEAVKSVDPSFTVGGPAICGVDDVRWLREFLEFCVKENIKPDFITRHHYMFDKPDFDGHYSYGELRDTYETLNELKVSRELIDSYELTKGLPMHITEFNTSYSPDSPVHDTCVNAAYIAWQISHMGQYADSYSYWTFGDIFEEKGVPFTPFHGGFGLVANGVIPKPTFWTFAFYKSLLEGKGVECSDDLTLISLPDGGYRGVAYNLCKNSEKLENMEIDLTLDLDINENEKICIITKLIDEEHGNPVKIWKDLGQPSHLSKEQLKLLKEHATPYVQTKVLIADKKTVNVKLTLEPNAVQWFEIRPVTSTPDRGFRSSLS